MDVPAWPFGQAHQLENLQPLVCSSMCRVGFQRRLPQPVNQVMLLPALRVSSSSSLAWCESLKGLDQGAVDPAIGAGNGFRAGAVDHVQRRQDATLLPQAPQRLTGSSRLLSVCWASSVSSRTRARKSDRPNGVS